MAEPNAVVALAIQELPTLVETFKAIFAEQHPDAPVPTDAEVIAAFHAAVTSSLAKDDAWLAAHPNNA